MSEAILLYDGLCGLCHGAVRFLSRRSDGRGLRFAPLHGPTAAPILRRHGLAGGPMGSFVLALDPGGPGERILLRSDAVADLGRRLGGPWAAAARLLRAAPRPLRDAAYDLVARNRRRWFGRLDACPTPPPALRDRFLP
jgi:predicted DCC family thiol-disulfide oxidoreductase YuxK